jgi:hypothetical protein
MTPTLPGRTDHLGVVEAGLARLAAAAVGTPEPCFRPGRHSSSRRRPAQVEQLCRIRSPASEAGFRPADGSCSRRGSAPLIPAGSRTVTGPEAAEFARNSLELAQQIGASRCVEQIRDLSTTFPDREDDAHHRLPRGRGRTVPRGAVDRCGRRTR